MGMLDNYKKVVESQDAVKTVQQESVLNQAKDLGKALEQGNYSDESSEESGVLLISVKTLLQELHTELQKELPEISNVLGAINLQLRKRPELTYMLSDEEISALYQAFLKKAFAASANKKGKKKSTTTVDKDGNSILDLLDKFM